MSESNDRGLVTRASGVYGHTQGGKYEGGGIGEVSILLEFPCTHTYMHTTLSGDQQEDWLTGWQRNSLHPYLMGLFTTAREGAGSCWRWDDRPFMFTDNVFN